MPTLSIALQDAYPDDFAHCFGCGRLNAVGHLLRTFAEGDGSISRFLPRPEHMAVPGFVYGGLLASLIDCHSMATASMQALRERGLAIGDEPSPRYVTAMLHVDYLRPTPLGPELVVRGTIEDFTPRKAKVSAWVEVDGAVTVRGSIVAVPMPSHMQRPEASPSGP